MSTTNDLPMYRVSFSRITGKEKGRDVLSYPREIGAVWPRKNGKAGGIIALDIVPAELALHQGVLFLTPVTDDEGGSQ